MTIGNTFSGFKTPLPFFNPPTLDKTFSTFNPWQNYNTPQDNAGWNYTSDPYFNAAANKPQWDLAQTGAGSEDDRARVWRFTIDTLHANGYDPGSAPAEAVQRAYLNSIARLKRDYMAPENVAKGMNWANSAYAGYDRFLVNAQPNPEGPSIANPNGGPAPTAPTPTPTPTPPATPPVTNPAQAPLAPTTTPPAAGGGPNNTLSAEWLQAHPDEALHQAFLARGIDITRPGPLQNFIRSRYAPLMQAAIGASGLGTTPQDVTQYMPNLLQMFGGVLNSTGGGGSPFLQGLAGIANGAMANPDVTKFLNMQPDQSDALKFFAQLQQLRMAGYNPMVQSALTGELNRQATNYLETYPYQQAQAGKDTAPFMDWWQNTPWAKFFQP